MTLPDVAPQNITVDAFLCDAVQEAGGKLHAIGVGWNMLAGPAFPLRHGRLGIGLMIHVPYTATNEDHEVRVGLVTEDGIAMLDPDGQDVISIGGTFNVGRPPHLQAGDEQIVPLALQIDGVVFPSPGLYAVVVSVDGTEARRLSFRLVISG